MKQVHKHRGSISCVLTTLVSLALSVTARADAQHPEDLAHYALGTVRIEHAHAAHGAAVQFKVWLADTEARQEQGLMFQPMLPVDRGMWFPVVPAHPMRMWMHNCYIALDMLYIDASGTVFFIKHNATPGSSDIIADPQGRDASAVLEIAGGEAARRGIRLGDHVVQTALAR